MMGVLTPQACWAVHKSKLETCLHLVGSFIWNVWWCTGRSQWPRGLSRRSAAARLLRSWVWIPPGRWMFICCECCVLSGRGLCDELITRPEKSYRLWCGVVCDLETSRMRRPSPELRRGATAKKKKNTHGLAKFKLRHIWGPWIDPYVFVL
jgi:hypothetical protein